MDLSRKLGSPPPQPLHDLGKPPKKVIFLMARPFRGGGIGLAIKEKITFFFILLSFVNKHYYFTLDKLSKYGRTYLR